MDDNAIWQAVRILIDAHGDDTAIHAAMQSELALERGCQETAAVWKRVWVAVEELQRQRPNADEALN